MDFSTISIVKHPIDRVWTAMRDDLPKLVDLMGDIESIRVESRDGTSPVCKIVNVWTARPQFPQVIAQYLDSDTFVWTDRAEWHQENMECRWSIEPHRFRDRIRCSGLTKFSPAMGGRGTRVSFSGDVEWNDQNLTMVPGFFEQAVYKSVEALLRSLIPRNFRKISDALEKHLDANAT